MTRRVERYFCPHCGAEAYDCTGENDWACKAECGGRIQLITPLRERDLQGQELIRLRLESEQLKEAIRQLQKPSSPETET